MKVNVTELVGENCITMEDGEKVYQLIHPELLARHSVELDFAGIEVFASPFLNVAIGRLLKDVDPKDLNQFLTISSLSDSGRRILQRVIENSKTFYSDPNYQKALDEVLVEQAEDI